MISRKFIIIGIIFLFNSYTIAQERNSTNPFWLSISAGGSSKYLNVSSSFNKALENCSYQIAMNANIEGILSGYGMTTANLGLGLAHHEDWIISSFYLGPSVSYGEARSELGNPTYFWGAGLTLNAQSYFMPLHKLFPGLGLGVELFYNFNAHLTKGVNYRNVYSVRIGFILSNIHMK